MFGSISVNSERMFELNSGGWGESEIGGPGQMQKNFIIIYLTMFFSVLTVVSIYAKCKKFDVKMVSGFASYNTRPIEICIHCRVTLV